MSPGAKLTARVRTRSTENRGHFGRTLTSRIAAPECLPALRSLQRRFLSGETGTQGTDLSGAQKNPSNASKVCLFDDFTVRSTREAESVSGGKYRFPTPRRDRVAPRRRCWPASSATLAGKALIARTLAHLRRVRTPPANTDAADRRGRAALTTFFVSFMALAVFVIAL